MSTNTIQSVRFEQSDKALGLYIEGIAVHEDGTEEVMDSTTVGSPREYTRIKLFKDDCRKQIGL